MKKVMIGLIAVLLLSSFVVATSHDSGSLACESQCEKSFFNGVYCFLFGDPCGGTVDDELPLTGESTAFIDYDPDPEGEAPGVPIENKLLSCPDEAVGNACVYNNLVYVKKSDAEYYSTEIKEFEDGYTIVKDGRSYTKSHLDTFAGGSGIESGDYGTIEKYLPPDGVTGSSPQAYDKHGRRYWITNGGNTVYTCFGTGECGSGEVTLREDLTWDSTSKQPRAKEGFVFERNDGFDEADGLDTIEVPAGATNVLYGELNGAEFFRVSEVGGTKKIEQHTSTGFKEVTADSIKELTSPEGRSKGLFALGVAPSGVTNGARPHNTGEDGNKIWYTGSETFYCTDESCSKAEKIDNAKYDVGKQRLVAVDPSKSVPRTDKKISEIPRGVENVKFVAVPPEADSVLYDESGNVVFVDKRDDGYSIKRADGDWQRPRPASEVLTKLHSEDGTTGEAGFEKAKSFRTASSSGTGSGSSGSTSSGAVVPSTFGTSGGSTTYAKNTKKLTITDASGRKNTYEQVDTVEYNGEKHAVYVAGDGERFIYVSEGDGIPAEGAWVQVTRDGSSYKFISGTGAKFDLTTANAAKADKSTKLTGNVVRVGPISSGSVPDYIVTTDAIYARGRTSTIKYEKVSGEEFNGRPIYWTYGGSPGALTREEFVYLESEGEWVRVKKDGPNWKYLTGDGRLTDDSSKAFPSTLLKGDLGKAVGGVVVGSTRSSGAVAAIPKSKTTGFASLGTDPSDVMSTAEINSHCIGANFCEEVEEKVEVGGKVKTVKGYYIQKGDKLYRTTLKDDGTPEFAAEAVTGITIPPGSEVFDITAGDYGETWVKMNRGGSAHVLLTADGRDSKTIPLEVFNHVNPRDSGGVDLTWEEGRITSRTPGESHATVSVTEIDRSGMKFYNIRKQTLKDPADAKKGYQSLTVVTDFAGREMYQATQEDLRKTDDKGKSKDIIVRMAGKRFKPDPRNFDFESGLCKSDEAICMTGLEGEFAGQLVIPAGGNTYAPGTPAIARYSKDDFDDNLEEEWEWEREITLPDGSKKTVEERILREYPPSCEAPKVGGAIATGLAGSCGLDKVVLEEYEDDDGYIAFRTERDEKTGDEYREINSRTVGFTNYVDAGIGMGECVGKMQCERTLYFSDDNDHLCKNSGCFACEAGTCKYYNERNEIQVEEGVINMDARKEFVVEGEDDEFEYEGGDPAWYESVCNNDKTCISEVEEARSDRSVGLFMAGQQDWQRTSRSILDGAQDLVGGWSSLSRALVGDAYANELAQDIDRGFAGTVLSEQYWESTVCYEKHGDLQDEGYAFIEIPGGFPQAVASIQAEVTEEKTPLLCFLGDDGELGCPHDLECNTQDQFCYDDLDDVDPQTGFFYKITWGVRAPADESLTPYADEGGVVSFNVLIRLEGENLRLYDRAIELDTGEHQSDVITHYSQSNFNGKEVCIEWVKNPLTMGYPTDAGEFVGSIADTAADTELDDVCFTIVGTEPGSVNFRPEGDTVSTTVAEGEVRRNTNW